VAGGKYICKWYLWNEDIFTPCDIAQPNESYHDQLCTYTHNDHMDIFNQLSIKGKVTKELIDTTNLYCERVTGEARRCLTCNIVKGTIWRGESCKMSFLKRICGHIFSGSACEAI
jgi:hypothetical protein